MNSFRLDDLHPHIYRTSDFGATWQEITSGIADNAPSNVVREDPVRKGLLYAGTETSVYVSFNDGDSWQPLQLNLPHTSMRDLVIHGDDLIVATHGRSFWILDDMTPLRQMSDQVAKSNAHLFAPQQAIRWRWNRNPDTPLPPEEPAGQNPPDGAIMDYYLSSAAKGPVMLEILDDKGVVVRRYTSTDRPLAMDKIADQHPIPMYWVRPTQILSGTPGMHRFVWDLHYEAPQALGYEFPISAIVHNTPLNPLGARALPGKYSVRLTVDDASQEQPLTVTMDPRIKAPMEDLRKQFEMESGAVQGMNQAYDALTQVKSVRVQLTELTPKAQGKLVDSLTALDKKCAQLEGATQSGFFGLPPSSKQLENLSTLNQHFSSILGTADSADVAPTTQAVSAFRELQGSQKELGDQWSASLQQEIPDLNRELKKVHLAGIDPQKPLAEKLGGAADGDDEP